jgi:hypothetical protein
MGAFNMGYKTDIELGSKYLRNYLGMDAKKI